MQKIRLKYIKNLIKKTKILDFIYSTKPNYGNKEIGVFLINKAQLKRQHKALVH